MKTNVITYPNKIARKFNYMEKSRKAKSIHALKTKI